LTDSNWEDFVQLFGANGACGGCWCMLWRLSRKRFDAQKGAGNKRAMRALVREGCEPGLLAYRGERAIGWCALAPRADYPALERSRVLSPVDDHPCWSVACLFVHREFRGQGVATALLRAAAEHARERGAEILEGYPVEPRGSQRIPPAFAWTGIPSAFRAAGFREVARRSPTRPIMRMRCRRP
jgi:GNAT superfamily N-acetyltransferase